MANILVLLREEASRTLLESGTAGVGGLQSGELGFDNESAGGVNDLMFSYRRRNGAGMVRVPTAERLAYAASAAIAGAKLVGYKPSGSLASTNVQDALDELAAGAGGGGGGGIGGGPLTAGIFPVASAANAVVNSILSQVSSKILFNGDSVANLYRLAASTLRTDGGLQVGGGLVVGSSGISSGGDVSVAGLISATSYVAGHGLFTDGYFASAVQDVSANLALGQHHVIRLTADGRTLTLPLASSVPGREYWIWFNKHSVTVAMSGSDVCTFLADSTEADTAGFTYGTGYTNGAYLKSDGVSKWYYWRMPNPGT